jgi:ribonuclease HI
LINVYNATHPSIPDSVATLERRGILPNSFKAKTILLGDFNTHHPWWDPLARQSANSDVLIDIIENHSLNLLNTPGEGTFYRPNMSIPSVLDLTLATQGIVNQVQDWQVLPDLGSDHYGVLFTILSRDSLASQDKSKALRFHTKKADWVKYKNNLQDCFKDFDYDINSEYSDQELDWLAEDFTNKIRDTADRNIPKTTASSHAKPWWNEDLKALRKSMQRLYRKVKASGYTLFHRELSDAKNSYFNSIKAEKLKHWNQFLETEDTQSIYKAMSYTKDTSSQAIPSIFDSQTSEHKSAFQDKCDVFRSTLFPAPPSTTPVNLTNYQPSLDWKWPVLSRIEVEHACTSKIKGKTPGPDLITQEIIVQAYSAIPDIFYIVYSILVNKGYHPKVWKQATGFILKKPKKPDYSQPKAYRVISLLNCLGKVSERILARRLSHLAETTTLLHPSQIGSRLQKSAIDAVLLLQNEAEVNKANKLKTSTLFLDVKGAFDHVSKNRLIRILADLKLPLSLISWISSFLESRVLRLAFDNNIEEFSWILTGIPQGSPISPILFLIYIRDLFKSTAIKTLSYMDDISLTASSKSFKNNIKILEREARDIIELGKEYAIKFDIEKTELIHFNCGKSSLHLTLPNEAIVAPSKLVRWLGIHLDSNLKFKEHIAIRTSLAKQAFYRLNRLSNVARGLSPFAVRQLYLACVTSVADYGSILWWNKPNKSQVRPLQAIQNLAIRKILGVFKTAPILPMELEAALPPVVVRLDHSRRRYAFRALKLAKNHPIRVEFESVICAISERPIDLGHGSDASSEVTDLPPNCQAIASNSQFESLVKSIYNLVDFQNLEPIRHFHFPPWDRDVPYSIRISNQPKIDEAKLHLQYLNSIRNTSTISIYTDGSQMPEGLGIGLGFAVYNHNIPHIPVQPTHTESWSIGDQAIVYNSEVEAVSQALEYASDIAKEGDHFNVFTDNQAGILRLKTPSDKPGQSQQIRAIRAARAIISTGATIDLVWVPGHTDIMGNEEADRLAKLATNSDEPISDKTSFAYLGIKINQLKKQEIYSIIEASKKSKSRESYSNIYPLRISKKIVLPLGTKRQLASSFFQLKLGHGYLKSYLHRLKILSDNKCACGLEETAKHLLLDCKGYRIERKALLRRIAEEVRIPRLSMPIILHTQIGIKQVLVFLKETNICTRAWHTQRLEEQQAEEQQEDDQEVEEVEDNEDSEEA